MTSATCARSCGSRSASVRRSGSCAVPRRNSASSSLCAYRRSSAMLRALETVSASPGITAVPYALVTVNPSPVSLSAFATRCSAGSEAGSRTQNSSPPIRYTAPAGETAAAAAVSFPARRARSASPAGWPKVSLYALKPLRSKSASIRGSSSRACSSSFARSRRSLRRLASPVSESVRASRRLVSSSRAFSRKVRAVRARTSTIVALARTRAIGWTGQIAAATSTPVARRPQTIGVPSSARSWSSTRGIQPGCCQAGSATRTSESGQTRSRYVPSAYVPTAVWYR